MIITNAGNVGIGTTNTNIGIDLYKKSIGVCANLFNSSSRPGVTGGTSVGEIRGYSANVPESDDGFLRISAGGGTNSYAKSYIDLSGYSTVSDMNNTMVFGTTGVERMRINASGKVGIGTNPAYGLDVFTGEYYTFRVKNTSYNTGIEVYNGNIFSTLTDNSMHCGWSDRRWVAVFSINGTIQTSDEKDKDFVPLTYGLTDLMNIETIKYKWKTQQDLPDTDPAKNYEYYGFKAGNLKTIFPELVYDESETLQLNYAELMPVLVNAIKEQQTLIQDLQTRITALEGR